jgi:hypothetical protein
MLLLIKNINIKTKKINKLIFIRPTIGTFEFIFISQGDICNLGQPTNLIIIPKINVKNNITV